MLTKMVSVLQLACEPQTQRIDGANDGGNIRLQARGFNPKKFHRRTPRKNPREQKESCKGPSAKIHDEAYRRLCKPRIYKREKRLASALAFACASLMGFSEGFKHQMGKTRRAGICSRQS